MKRCVFRFLIIGFLLMMMGTGMAQFQKLKIKIPKKIPGLDKILKSKPALTTSIEDAVTEVPFLDDFNPEGATPMTVHPRTKEGGFVLEYPGNYMFECQSYCLRAGTYAPGEGREGRGYLYAPLKGPQADIIRHILKRSYLHPEIPQQDIQVLLWAVIARTKIKNMSTKVQLTAAKLLTPEEIFRVNGGALGLIPKKLMDAAFENLPPAARRVIEAEARLRDLLTEAHSSYEELERVAVLQGDPPFEEGDREIPLGRWSFHPDGYFIRYFPRGYQRMLIELNVPEPVHVEKDGRGRITLIADGRGNRIETSYDDTIEPLSIPGDPAIKGYAFRSIRFERLDPENPREKLRSEWNDVGWTFQGVPAGRKYADASSGRFSDFKERYEWAERHKKELDDLYEGIKILGKKTVSQRLSQDNLEEIMAFAHYAIALKKAVGGEAYRRIDPVSLAKSAWQAMIPRYVSTSKARLVFDPADDPVPGRGASQRGGDSGSESDEGKNCDQQYEECRGASDAKFRQCIEDAFENHTKGKDCGCDDWSGIHKCLSRAKTPEERFDCLAGSCKWFDCETDKDFFNLLETCLVEHAADNKDCLMDHVNCND